MSLDPVANFGNVEVSTGYDDAATSIDLASGEASKLPDPSTDGAFNLVWFDADNYGSPSEDPNKEIIRVTAISGDTLTVSRGQEDTSASTKNTAGATYQMLNAPTKKMMDDIQTEIDGAGGGALEFGDGSDGALDVSSGTTSIDLGGARVVEKNYTSISITGSGKVEFTNPHNEGTIIKLRSQGDVTLTSSSAPMLDGNFCGAKGGSQGTSEPGMDGYLSTTFYRTDVEGGDSSGGGSTGGGASNQDGGDGSNSDTGGVGPKLYTSFFDDLEVNNYPIIIGAGGASGGDYIDSVIPRGGRGGPAMVIFCGGSWEFTTSNGISVDGEDGRINTSGSNDSHASGAGGAGTFFAFVKSITSNTGTISSSGGLGATSAQGGGDSGDGGDGYSQVIEL